MQDLFRTLPAILKDVEGAAAVREAFVFVVWRRIAGESLSVHAIPLRLKSTKLSIAVANKTWQCHLQDLSSQLLFKLNAAIGERTVEFIEFVVDAGAIEKAKGTSRIAAEDAEIPEDLRTSATSIEDENLRELFLGAAANCLARKMRDRAA